MNIRILNREGQIPADNWYQIEVVGEHYNPGADLVQVIDARAVEHIVNRFAEEAKAPNFAGMRIGKDHLADDMSQPTEALGWLMELRNRDGQPEGRIEWTLVGRPLIESKPGQPPVYKFFTTEYDVPDTEPAGTVKIRNRDVRAVRPLRLAGLDVTNKPNNKGGKPISNRDPGTQSGRSENQPTDTMNPKVLKLLAALGVTLAPDAAPEAVDAALDQGIAKAGEAGQIKNRLTTAEAELSKLRDAQMATDLDARKDKITNREAVEKMYRADRDGTLALLDGVKGGGEQPARITNRETAKTPPAGGGDAADQAEAAKAKRIKNRADELKAQSPRRSFSACFGQARSEIESA